MPTALAIRFAGCLLVQALLAQVSPSPWWVPDLSLVSLLVLVSHVPAQWLPWSALAGLWVSVWALRVAWPLLLGYVALGWLVRRCAYALDTSDLSTQGLLVGLAAILLTLALVWVEHLWTLTVLGGALLRVIVTVLAVPVVRRVIVRSSPTVP